MRQAGVKLHRKTGQKPVPSEVRTQTEQAIERATKASGERPADVHVMANMATAYVSGSSEFLRELVSQPEIAAAVANQSETTG